MDKRLAADQAAALIDDGVTVLVTGSGGGLMDADYVYRAIEERFLTSNHPRGINLIHATGIGRGDGSGITRFAHEGLVRRVIGGHWAWSPEMIALAQEDKIEAYNLPQGVLSLLTREAAAGRSGLCTTVGLHTFVDPRLDGGKLNDAAEEDLVKTLTLNGRDQLFYKTPAIDVAIIRATTADETGNLSVEEEAANLDILAAAQAAYNNGGTVIAQVKQVAQAGTLPARSVHVPGHVVDAVVVHTEQWQTSAHPYNPSFSGQLRVPLDTIAPLDLDMRKVVARRAAMEVMPGSVVNLGFGIADGVANVIAEEGLIDDVTFSVEQGIVGGVPAKGDIFGAGYNPNAIVNAPDQFDFYHGGGLDVTCLGMAQIDREGNVNVSKFGSQLPGCGGFIDISQNTAEVVFCGTFTAGGLDVRLQNGQLSIAQEGRIHKFVDRVEHVTFSGAYARRKGQRVLYVTERAVFALRESGLELVEVAPGLDVDRHVLAPMDFQPTVSPNLTEMDPRIFRPDVMNLQADTADYG